jgi:hypothetical protein
VAGGCGAVAGTVTVLVAAAWLGTTPPGRAAGWRVLLAAAGSGVPDAAANVSYLLAARAGLFGTAVVITSAGRAGAGSGGHRARHLLTAGRLMRPDALL